MKSAITIVFVLLCLIGNAQTRQYLIAGQSNSRGRGDVTLSITVAPSTSLEYRPNTNQLIQLQDPVGLSAGGFQSAGTGSAWPGFGKTYYDLTGDTTVLVPAARGGSGLHSSSSSSGSNWSASGSLFNLSTFKMDQSIALTGLSVDGIVWLQGETDANRISLGFLTQNQYQDALIDLIERYRDHYGCNIPFYIVLIGTNTEDPIVGYDAVRVAQFAVANSHPHTYIIYEDTQFFPGFGWMSDNVHYNQDGYNDVGTVGAMNLVDIENTYYSITSNGSDTICAGDSVLLVAPPNHQNYLWSTGGTSNQIYANAGGTYNVTVTDANGCTIPMKGTTIYELPQAPRPSVNISIGDDMCVGNNLMLNAAPASGNYVWSTGATTPSISVTTAGYYFVQTLGANGCLSEASDSIFVSPTLTLTALDPTLACIGDSTTLSAPPGFNNYQWSNGDDTPNTTVSNTGIFYCTITDINGCTAVDSIEVTPSDSDTEPPFIECPENITVTLTGPCNNGMVVNWNPPFYSDNCSDVQIASTVASGSVFPVGVTTVSYVVADAANNITTCTFEVHVIDDEAPVIQCPTDIVVSTPSGVCEIPVTWNVPVYSDNCQGAVLTSNLSSGSTFLPGTTPVIYTVTDANGNTATCGFDITVIDSQTPIINCPADVMVNAASGACRAVATWTIPQITDNCINSLNVFSTHQPGNEFPIGCTTVTYIVTDETGNTAGCNFSVCVNECTGGGITPTTETITLLSDNDLFIGAADAQSFASNSSYLFTDPATPANAVISNATLQLFFRVENASCESDIQIRITDPAGNIVTTTTLFNACNGSGPNPYPGALYNVTIPVPGGTFTGSNADWTIEFRDTNDQNAGAVEYSVRFGRLIYDVTVPGQGGCTAPVIVNCPADIESCDPVLVIPEPVFGVDFTDCSNATMTNDFTGTSDASGTYPPGITTVIWTVTDSDGNTTTCEQTINISGNGGGTTTLICPSDINLVTTPGNCGVIATWMPPVATDGCGTPTLSSNYNPGDEFPVGCTTVTYTVVGTNTTCDFEICVTECMGSGGSSSTETITLLSDNDLFIGAADAQSFSSNSSYLFTDPATPANAVISNATLQLFFRVENASCESDIEIRITDPAGNIVTTTTLFNTCNGSGSNPFPGALYNVTIPVPGGTFTGSNADWTIEFRDTNDQNAGAVEYSVRFGRLIYDATVTQGGQPGCTDPVIVNCPADVESCNPTVVIPEPMFGVDFTDCTGAAMTNNYNGTSNASGTYPSGITTVIWTVTDAGGNTATCEQIVNITGSSTSTTETITLLSDNDLFIGAADAQSFASNSSYLFTDPATPANAVISNATLQLFFRVENASCENDIEIRLTDPAGNVVTTTTLFNTCNGSGPTPYPGALYNVTIPVPSGAFTGTNSDWVIEFRDANDQNAGAVEYSVRFGRLIYDVTVTDCAEALANDTNVNYSLSRRPAEALKNENIKCYPVPTTGQLFVEYTAKENSPIEMQVINTNGQLVQTTKKEVSEGINTYEMNIHDLPDGTYYIRTISEDGEVEMKPFVKLIP